LLREPKVTRYSFRGFDEAEKLFYKCAEEKFLAPLTGDYLECDFCPCYEECIKFWNDYVAREPESGVEAYLEGIGSKLNEFQLRKLSQLLEGEQNEDRRLAVCKS